MDDENKKENNELEDEENQPVLQPNEGITSLIIIIFKTLIHDKF